MTLQRFRNILLVMADGSVTNILRVESDFEDDLEFHGEPAPHVEVKPPAEKRLPSYLDSLDGINAVKAGIKSGTVQTRLQALAVLGFESKYIGAWAKGKVDVMRAWSLLDALRVDDRDPLTHVKYAELKELVAALPSVLASAGELVDEPSGVRIAGLADGVSDEKAA